MHAIIDHCLIELIVANATAFVVERAVARSDRRRAERRRGHRASLQVWKLATANVNLPEDVGRRRSRRSGRRELVLVRPPTGSVERMCGGLQLYTRPCAWHSHGQVGEIVGDTFTVAAVSSL